MRLNKFVGVVTATAMAALTLATGTVQADQNSKNQWRNFSIGSGALGVLGLLSGNTSLGWLGLGASAYSANRYEQDRHHQSERDNDYSHERHFHENYDRDHDYYNYR